MKTMTAAVLLLMTPSFALAQYSRTADQRQTPPELWNELEKQKLDIGFSANRVTGNVDSTFVGGSLRYGLRINGRNTILAEGSTAYNTYGGAITLDKRNISLLYTYSLTPWLNAYGWTAHAQNLFLSLRYRTTNGAGFCAHGPLLYGILDPVAFSLGVAPEYARYYDGEQSRKFRANARLVFRIPVSDTLTIGEDLVYFVKSDEFADFRIYSEAYADLVILPGKLSYRVTVTDEYDNRPFPGIKDNDFTLSQGLVVHLGK